MIIWSSHEKHSGKKIWGPPPPPPHDEGLDGVNAQLRAREEEKRNHDVVRRLLDEAGTYCIQYNSRAL